MATKNKSRSHPAGTTSRPRSARSAAASICRYSVASLALALSPIAAHAGNLVDPWFGPGAYDSWISMVSASQAAQPHWMTPLVTVTPRLEQEIRVDFYDQHNGTGTQGNGYQVLNWGGGKGIEFIPTYDTEIILAPPPIEQVTSPKGVVTTSPGDWPVFLAKYRIISGNEQNGNYIVSAFFQMSDPLGFNALGTSDKITNNVLIAQPTLAFGKGWGDFDVQATISQQYPIAALSSPGNSASTNQHNFGDPVLFNTAFQYHLFEYFWPELEVNYEYWPNGEHQNLSQVMLTPGLILGRFSLGGRENLIIGAGYQFAVTANPVIANNWVVTARLTF